VNAHASILSLLVADMVRRVLERAAPEQVTRD